MSASDDEHMTEESEESVHKIIDLEANSEDDDDDEEYVASMSEEDSETPVNTSDEDEEPEDGGKAASTLPDPRACVPSSILQPAPQTLLPESSTTTYKPGTCVTAKTLRLVGKAANQYGAHDTSLAQEFVGLCAQNLEINSLSDVRIWLLRSLQVPYNGHTDGLFLAELIPKKINSELKDVYGRNHRGCIVALKLGKYDKESGVCECAREIHPLLEDHLFKKFFLHGKFKRAPSIKSLLSIVKACAAYNGAANGAPNAKIMPIVDAHGTCDAYKDDTKSTCIIMSTKLQRWLESETAENVAACRLAYSKQFSSIKKQKSTSEKKHKPAQQPAAAGKRRRTQAEPDTLPLLASGGTAIHNTVTNEVEVRYTFKTPQELMAHLMKITGKESDTIMSTLKTMTTPPSQ